MTEELSVDNMLPTKFEPKRNFRWFLEIDEIDAFLMKKAEMPKFYRREGHFKVENFRFEMYNPIAPSGSQQVMKWIKSKESRTGILKLLDHLGRVVEKWELTELELVSVDFGSLDYADSSNLTIFVECSCKQVFLLDLVD